MRDHPQCANPSLSSHRGALPLITVNIESLAPGGDAFGRQVGGAADGRATFVPLAAPGERVRARIVREKRDVAFAELVEVQTPSPARVNPPCPLFGACGGCQWQHVNIETQQAAKLAIVKRALRTEAVSLRTPCPPFGYRDRAKFVSVRRGSQALLGFKRRQSHEVIDVPACPLLSAPAAAALAQLRQALPPEGDVFVQAAPNGTVGVKSANGTQIMGRHGESTAATLNIAGSNQPPLHIAVGGFAQVGAAANDELVACALAYVGDKPGSILELYAGAGNFTRFLIDRSSHVVASDADATALALGRTNVPAAQWHLPDELDLTQTFDTVFVDPPRTGLDALGFDLARLADRAIVYVSCDPQTLSRDVRRLADYGFVVAGASALDLMPQTHHVEVVVRLERT